ncbi:MAG: hypothetical protein K8I82_19880 [Anaerolineae bacterium]|nr:hypothetical protein [Anaerolineae bacterium]
MTDTQPKSPMAREHLEETGPHRPVLPPPYKAETESGCLQSLLILAVLGISSCMCLVIVVLAGFAGIRDQMEVIGTEAVQVQQTDVANQYQRGVEDMEAGRYELAGDRFAYVLTEVPDYENASGLLQQVLESLNITPTPEASPTTALTATFSPTPEESEPPTATLEAPTPTRRGPTAEGLYSSAETAIFMGNYEEAISWLDALIQLDSSYRRSDVNRMLVESLTVQGRAYLRGMNQDGEDQLARGVQLIDRAAELGYTGDLIYEADFVRRYLSARSYVEGGALGPALDVLGRLCEENCDWAYRGVSVEDLLTRAGGSRQN